MIKLLIGGSPCTHWSISKTRNRETEPSGIGWELFKNFLIALEKYKPDYFLYENIKSMSAAIRDQITREFGVAPIEINSALVSAQSRKRLYWTNIPGVELPEDRGILLRDILESGVTWKEKAYTLRASAGAHSGISNILRSITTNGKFGYLGAAEPVQTGDIESRTRAGPCIAPLNPNCVEVMPNTKGEAANDAAAGLHAVPTGIAWRGRDGGSVFEARKDQKANAITADGHQSRLVVEPHIIVPFSMRPIHVGTIESGTGDVGQGHRVYSADGKSKTLCGNGGGAGAKTGLYTVPVDFLAMQVKEPPKGCAAKMQKPHRPYRYADKIYEVQNGQITIKGQQYPIKLRDGFYIIRKLTVTECKRLQTVPDNYQFPVSNTQAYRLLGNGWTADVVAHILSYIPGIGIRDEPVEIFSMYDGMSCGHIALDKVGAQVAAYYATEIDKYGIQTTQANYPGTIQLGDAVQVRDRGWKLPPFTKSRQPLEHNTFIGSGRTLSGSFCVNS